MPALGGELVRKQVADIVATGGTASALTAKAATTTIPIAFVVGDDPVRLGLVPNLKGSIFSRSSWQSGWNSCANLCRERPVSRCSFRQCCKAEATVQDEEAAARAMGLQIQVLNGGSSNEITGAFASIEPILERADRALFALRQPPQSAQSSLKVGP